MENEKKEISKPTRERLIKLIRLLRQVELTGKEKISSTEIQQRTGWTNFTVRRDISSVGIKCSSSTGYDVSILKSELMKYLKLDEAEKPCCIVGLGLMGEAFATSNCFQGSNFVIVAGFDSSVNRIETLNTSFPLYSTLKMEQVIKENGIEYAILTVPEKVAQETAMKLSMFGIKGIVNFTSAVLRLPPETKVENLSVVDSLQNLSARNN